MRRLMMRRVGILLMVVAMALALAAPATGKQPDNPGKPSPSSAPIAAYVEAVPWWVHEAGDTIVYTFIVQNMTGDTVEDVVVSMAYGDEIVDSAPKDVDPRTEEVPHTVFEFERDVLAGDFPEDGSAVDLTATASVSYGNSSIVPTVPEVLADEYKDCGFSDKLDATGLVEPPSVVLEAGACIWHTTLRGAWTVSVLPSDSSVRNMRVFFRDHVPGNFCNADGSSGPISARWNSKDEPREPLALDVLLPNDGVCRVGGAGGATMPIGNPDSFYLWVRHDAVVAISETP
jgi:hypothetical protein